MDPFSAQRYEESAIAGLEQAVAAQAAGSATYDKDAVLAIIRLYALYPHRLQGSVMVHALGLALKQLPTGDFHHCIHMIPDSVQSEEPVSVMVNMAALLESGAFCKFWEAAKQCRDLLNTIDGFDASIRNFILGVLKATYTRAKASYVAALLDVSEGELKAMAAAEGVQVEGDAVTFTASDAQNRVRQPDLMNMPQLAKFLTTVS
eukprot:TRINITY_DN20671_c0_g1_i1.p1 TRINITY_DN20671_c0_g1~~TRINITY_DN20671_c0_g1_i1.p1  ORF type:complete len:205 (-),score=81.74 TRINITY_DN20671_c0_g1_i1:39-653(-)